jgi:endonuclease-3
MAVTERTKKILKILDDYYGTDFRCSLDHRNAWQLLFATILSAQCTDARVNIVTKDLYQKYPSIQAFADADLQEMETAVKPTGFHRNKAKNLILCARKIIADFDGEVPRTLEELTSLPGVGRKTANVIRGNIYHDPSIVVDTHVKRISYRLGLTTSEDPTQIEKDLMKKLPEDHWILWNIHLITFGREICTARRPKCDSCPLSEICRSKDKEKSVDK